MDAHRASLASEYVGDLCVVEVREIAQTYDRTLMRGQPPDREEKLIAIDNLGRHVSVLFRRVSTDQPGRIVVGRDP
jgi:hypothetical protein